MPIFDISFKTTYKFRNMDLENFNREELERMAKMMHTKSDFIADRLVQMLDMQEDLVLASLDTLRQVSEKGSKETKESFNKVCEGLMGNIANHIIVETD
jgi:hypothetical protein